MVFKIINEKKLTRKEIMICDTCGEHIISYGHDWIVVESHKGAWKDNPEELKTFHFCSNECINTWLKGGDFLERRTFM